MSNDNNAATAALIEATDGPIDRDARNPHAKFSYASADAVYAAVRGPLGEAGLIPWVHEEKTELITPQGQPKPTIWVRSTFRVGLAPAYPPPDFETFERVTVWDRLNSPQTSQALRTYALKYYLRGKLLLSTGEPDVDASAEKKRKRKRGKSTGDEEIVINFLSEGGPTMKLEVENPSSLARSSAMREALIAAHKADIPRERIMHHVMHWEPWGDNLRLLKKTDFEYIKDLTARYQSISESKAEPDKSDSESDLPEKEDE